MNALAQFGTASLLVLHLTAPVLEHGQSGGKANHNWDFGVWVARATGKENHNSFCEAQIFAAGVSVGRVVTDEIGEGWRRGHLEYIFNLIPVFLHPTPQSLYGGGFERMILRWNSGLPAGRVTPHFEFAGGGLWTNGNLPAGDTSDFNFTARGGGGIQIFARNRKLWILASGGGTSPTLTWVRKIPSSMDSNSAWATTGLSSAGVHGRINQ